MNVLCEIIKLNTDLIKVWEAVWVLAEALVLSSESISCCYLPELLQVDHIQGTTGWTHEIFMCGKRRKEHTKSVSVSDFQNPDDASARSSTWCLPDVVFTSCEVARPVAGLPEAVAVHLPPALAERSVTVRCSLQVEVTQLLQVCSHNLKETQELFSQKSLRIQKIITFMCLMSKM